MLPHFKKKLLPLSLAISTILLSACNSDDANTAPELTGDVAPVVAENTVVVGQYTAIDAENDNITYGIAQENSDLFIIDQTGQLSFKIAPDFENGDTGPFAVTIFATDDGKGALSTLLKLSITVGDVKDTPSIAVVQTIAPDYSNSEVAYLDAKSQQVASGYYVKDASDYTINSYKGDVYHIGKYDIDTIAKYNASNITSRDTQVWEYSTNDVQSSVSSNPYTLVSLSETKAYLLRYGSSKVWIVNPQASNSEDFKIGELDLTDYVPADHTSNTPSPSSAVINDGKLFIAMQRFSGYAAGVAYIAVFDTTTDLEVETNANTEDAVKGIPLTGVNPLANSLTSSDNSIFVTTRNGYSAVDLSFSRIEEINTADYTVRQVLNAGDIEGNTASFIKASVIVSPEQGYFYASQAFFSPYREVGSVYEFNPTTGEILTANVAETGTENISFIGLDSANFLWMSIANPEAPGVDVIDTTTNKKYINRLTTTLNPGTVRFIEE